MAAQSIAKVDKLWDEWEVPCTTDPFLTAMHELVVIKNKLRFDYDHRRLWCLYGSQKATSNDMLWMVQVDPLNRRLPLRNECILSA
jgi:hypothetical protein